MTLTDDRDAMIAIAMNGGTALCIEVDLRRIERRISSGYLDERAGSLELISDNNAGEFQIDAAFERAIRNNRSGSNRAFASRNDAHAGPKRRAR